MHCWASSDGGSPGPEGPPASLTLTSEPTVPCVQLALTNLGCHGTDTQSCEKYLSVVDGSLTRLTQR